jgi:hypothetical protein
MTYTFSAINGLVRLNYGADTITIQSHQLGTLTYTSPVITLIVTTMSDSPFAIDTLNDTVIVNGVTFATGNGPAAFSALVTLFSIFSCSRGYEIDPIFTGSPAFLITGQDILNWNSGVTGGGGSFLTQDEADGLYKPISYSPDLSGYALINHTHTFSSLTSKPTTIAGYGITDAFTQTSADALYAPLTHTHSFSSLTSKPTTLSGYGITDAYPLSGNPSGFLTSVAWSAVTGKPSFATVATTGDYNDLINKPTGSGGTVSDADTLNGFSGSYYLDYVNFTNVPDLSLYETGSHASSTYATQSNLSTTNSNVAGKEPSISAGTTSQYWRGDKSWQTLNATAVGLSNVENKSSATIRGELTGVNVTTALGYTPYNAANLSITSPSNGQLQRYNSSTAKWENWTPTFISSYTETDPLSLKIANNLSDLASVSSARTNLGLGALATLGSVALSSQVTGILPVANGGTGSSSLTSGALTYYNGSVIGSSALQWNDSINLLGINTTPTHTITIPYTGTGIAYYNTPDQTTNFERARLYWSSNAFTITTERLGSASVRDIVLNGNNLQMQTNGSLRMKIGITSMTGGVNIGYSTATDGSILGINPTLTSVGQQNSVAILPTFNQSSGGSGRSLWISPFEQALGTGSYYLLDAGTNSAAGGGGTHSSRFAVDNKGNVTTNGITHYGPITPTTRDALTSVVEGSTCYNTTDGYMEYFDAFWGWMPVHTSNEWRKHYGVEYFRDFYSISSDGMLTLSSVNSGAILSSMGPSGSTSESAGTMALSMSTTNNARVFVTSNSGTVVLGSGATVYETRVQFPALSTSIDRYQAVFGFYDLVSSGLDQVDGVYFLYDEGGISSGSATSANWQIVTASNSVRSIFTTTSSIASNTWYNLRIEVNSAATNISFHVNGIQIGNITTNIPKGIARASGLGMFVQKSAGTTTRNVLVNYLGFKQKYTTPR